MFKWEY